MRTLDKIFEAIGIAVTTIIAVLAIMVILADQVEGYSDAYYYGFKAVALLVVWLCYILFEKYYDSNKPQ